jgi:hypothetical protein
VLIGGKADEVFVVVERRHAWCICRPEGAAASTPTINARGAQVSVISYPKADVLADARAAAATESRSPDQAGGEVRARRSVLH